MFKWMKRKRTKGPRKLMQAVERIEITVDSIQQQLSQMSTPVAKPADAPVAESSSMEWKLVPTQIDLIAEGGFEEFEPFDTSGEG